MSIRKGISGITNALIWVVALMLATCLLAAHVNPNKLPFAGLLTLGTPFLIIFNVGMLIYALARAKRAGWVSLIMVLLSVPQIGNLWGFRVFPDSETSPTFRIMSYNVRNFDLYDWSHNDLSKEMIFKVLETEAPDIICFQEFYSKPGSKPAGNWDNIRRIRESLELQHYYFSREVILDAGRQWGVATFSRYPIASYGEILQERSINSRGKRPYRGIYTDLAIGQDTIRIINIHLASIYLQQEDYSTIEQMQNHPGKDLVKYRTIIGKLNRAFKKRGYQVKALKQFLADTVQPYPIVICGDLNDVPTSYAYNALSRDLQDAFLTSGWGAGATYNGPIPGLRIDHILVDERLEVLSSKVVPLDVSDHSPVISGIKIPGDR